MSFEARYRCPDTWPSDIRTQYVQVDQSAGHLFCPACVPYVDLVRLPLPWYTVRKHKEVCGMSGRRLLATLDRPIAVNELLAFLACGAGLPRE